MTDERIDEIRERCKAASVMIVIVRDGHKMIIRTRNEMDAESIEKYLIFGEADMFYLLGAHDEYKAQIARLTAELKKANNNLKELVDFTCTTCTEDVDCELCWVPKG